MGTRGAILLLAAVTCGVVGLALAIQDPSRVVAWLVGLSMGCVVAGQVVRTRARRRR